MGSSIRGVPPPELSASMSSHFIKSEMPLTSMTHHYFCATRKEGMLPRNLWHAIECKMHPNFETIKWEEKCAFSIDEIWSLLFQVRLP